GLEVEIIGNRCSPESKSVDRLAAVAHHRPIKRNADQTAGLAGNHLEAPAVQPDLAIQFDLHPLMGPGNLPGVRAAQPVVRLLGLPAVADGLAEDAVLIA